MSRITKTDLSNAVGTLQRTMRRAGMIRDDELLQLQHGSKVSGISFKLMLSHSTLKGMSGTRAPGTGYAGFIGTTSGEAHETITTMIRTLDALSNNTPMTRAEIVNGTGFRLGQRFLPVPN